MAIYKIETFFLNKWWASIVFWLSAVVLVVISVYLNTKIFQKISYILLGLSLIGLIFSSIFQLIKKRWVKGIITGLALVGTIAIILFIFLLQIFIATVDGDKWANDLIIPDDIEIYSPKGDYNKTRPDSILTIKRTNIDFELYNSFQPGLYEFDFWIDEIESGIIFLKAYEITQNYALSTSSLQKKTTVNIQNSSDSIMRFGTTSDFTIYEGDWGKQYAARFEVWYKPDYGEKERKLFEKNYIIEGWQR